MGILRWVKTGLECIIWDKEIYKEIAIIRRSGIQFTEIKLLLGSEVRLCVWLTEEPNLQWDWGLCASRSEERRNIWANCIAAYPAQKML